MNSDHDLNTNGVPTAHPDFIIRRSNWATISITVGLLILILFGGSGFNFKPSHSIALFCFIVGLFAFLRMPVLGANKFGIQIYKFYHISYEVIWENIIDADLESKDKNAFLILTKNDGKCIKIKLDWHNVEQLLSLIKSQINEHRISAKLKSLFETGEIPLNI